ncbi:CDP-alcohol phosphatidyltransferase family protein [Sphingopyxis kveilinensis]|uniref:CDP-alcohol phosphatidyltransferase family protein n=1 Tax=Sphingopyxis kveilinensis TaxID=3114367 RepID=UPI0030D461E5
MTLIALHFAHEATANCLVAGIPAAARAVHQVALAAQEGAAIDCCVVAVAGGWVPSPWCRAELARLAPSLRVEWTDSDALSAAADVRHFRGEDLLPARTILDLSRATTGARTVFPAQKMMLDDMLRELRDKGDAIIAATAKPGDGIVSRYINRPVSRLISRAWLRASGVKPIHATIVAAMLGLVMALCLFAGGEIGLVIGAVLFQLASIVDGVDGEIARATYRSSPRGAMLDSMTDAATNLSFFAGLCFNLWQQGQVYGAAAGAAGLVLLAVGLFLIGRRAHVSGRAFTFDAVKERFGANPSRLKQWLTWLTMRDFYAAAAAICVVAGFASQMLMLFAVVAVGWFITSMAVLGRAGYGHEAAAAGVVDPS